MTETALTRLEATQATPPSFRGAKRTRNLGQRGWSSTHTNPAQPLPARPLSWFPGSRFRSHRNDGQRGGHGSLIPRIRRSPTRRARPSPACGRRCRREAAADEGFRGRGDARQGHRLQAPGPFRGQREAARALIRPSGHLLPRAGEGARAPSLEPARLPACHGPARPYSRGMTSTRTITSCSREPRMMPATGEMSA